MSSSRILPIAAIAIVLVAAVAAIVVTGGSGGTAATAPPSAASTPVGSAASTPLGSAASGAPAASAGAPVVSGSPLPAFQQTVGDPAIGTTIPTVAGTNFSGEPVAIDLDGKPKILIFLAHWCTHCQAEVPLVQAWMNAGGLPDGVELISVATAIDPARPNYPPAAWLEREGWSAPVIDDETGSVATAYGLSAFPFWVFVNGDGTVAGRAAGELPIADVEAIIASLTR
jgi:thiol-disulfide isomerase/thioredoxin